MSDDLDRSKQEEAEEAFAIESQIKQAMADGRDALWRLAESLYLFDEAKGWHALGYENLSHWLAEADVSITRPTYYRYVRTWRKLVVQKQIDANRIRQLDQAKVAIVADKIAANEVLVEDALNDVESLGARDLREKYYSKPEPAQNPATTDEVDSGQVVEPAPVDEPPTADELGVKLPPYADEVNIEIVSVPLEATLDGEPVEVTVEVGEVVDGELVEDEAELESQVAEAEVYEFPGWVTQTAIDGMLAELRSAVDSGASFPRIGRKHCQIAIELAQAWLASHPS